MEQQIQDLYEVLNGILPTYPGKAPENATLPVIVYLEVARTNPQTVCGYQNDIQSSLIQIDLYTKTYIEQMQYAEIIRQELQLFNTTNNILNQGETSMFDESPELHRRIFQIKLFEKRI